MHSSPSATKRYLLALCIVSCLLLEAFTLVIYFENRNSKSSNEWVMHSHEVLRLARVVMIDAADLVNQEQNYAWTGDGRFRTAYNQTQTDIDLNLAMLASATEDNGEQIKNTAALKQSVDQLKQIGNVLMQEPPDPANVAKLRSGAAALRKASADVRHAFDSFVQSESLLLEVRNDTASSGQRKYLRTLFLGGLLGLGALMFANRIIFLLIAKNARAEKKLRKSEELFSIVLRGINDGIYDVDIAKGTIDYSASYQEILGYSEKELGTDVATFTSRVHPDDVAHVRENLTRYLAREIPTYSVVYRLRHKDGRWLWILSRGVGVWDKDGKIQRLIGSHTDISAHKKREEELHRFILENEQQRRDLAEAKEKAETAYKVKSDFLATISHEIRTPMNAVIGLAHLLLQSPLDAKQQKMVKTLKINTDILLQLVNDLLDLSRIESGHTELEKRSFTIEDVFATIEAMFTGMIAAKGLVFSTTNHIGDQPFIGDPSRIQQILVNLLGNALKFTSKGAISMIATYALHSDDRADIRIAVTDTGVGIAADKLSTVFEKFVQADQTISRRFGGSGLGLSICQSLARLMGGEICVSSLPDQGSTFTLALTLPVDHKQRSKPVALPDPTSTGNLTGGHILVVEDYAPNIMVATLMLEHLGYAVDVATGGADAIAKVQSRPYPYNAILMDVQMPDMDGFETTRRIRAWEKGQGFRHLIIGVTAHAFAEDRERCLKQGMDAYMSKPINLELLAEKLELWSEAA